MTTRRSLWLGGAALVGAALAAAAWPVPVLEVENASRGRTVRAALGADQAFSVVTHHSMYDAPVTEDFVVSGGRIVLQAVSSPSAAVREYFGIVAPGERHAMTRVMPEVVFRVAAGVPQQLRVGGGTRSFLEMGDHGDRLVVRAARAPAISRWLVDRFAAPP